MNLFGKKKAAPAPRVDPMAVIQQIKEKITLLEQREQHLYANISKLTIEAKQKAMKKDKTGALFCLKKKKLYEQDIAKIQGTRMTLENQVLSLESAKVNTEVFRTVEMGTNAMKQIQGNVTVDRVDELMDSMQEQKETADLISEAIARPGQDMCDEDELAEELAALEELDYDDVLLGEGVTTSAAASAAPAQPAPASQAATAPSTVYNFPTAPTSSILPVAPTGPVGGGAAPSKTESEEERALRELEASMM